MSQLETFFAHRPEAQRAQFEAALAAQAVPEGVVDLVLTELAAYPQWPAQFEVQFPRLLARAGAKLRAAEAATPSLHRHLAQSDDFEAVQDGPLYGEFHKLGRLRLDYTRFDGGRAQGVLRDTFLGGDAAIILPYDPARDRILLVEQLRPGPIRRGDRQPWILEPVAGLIEAWDRPEVTALRELEEEAHLQVKALLPAYSYYPSPGASSEYFYCYLALVDLPDDHPRFGGLEEEAEDLRLHLLSIEEARAALAFGEINAGPLITLLLELFARRETLRGGTPTPSLEITPPAA